jgi:hypothetical protein
MHVHDDQSIARLREDVNTVELSQGHTEGLFGLRGESLREGRVIDACAMEACAMEARMRFSG